MSFAWPTFLFTLLCIPLLVLLYLRIQQRRQKFATRYGSLALIHDARWLKCRDAAPYPGFDFPGGHHHFADLDGAPTGDP